MIACCEVIGVSMRPCSLSFDKDPVKYSCYRTHPFTVSVAAAALESDTSASLYVSCNFLRNPLPRRQAMAKGTEEAIHYVTFMRRQPFSIQVDDHHLV